MTVDIQKKPTTVIVIPCPMCNSSLLIDNPITIGKIYECKKCATESEILELNPLTIAPIEEEK